MQTQFFQFGQKYNIFKNNEEYVLDAQFLGMDSSDHCLEFALGNCRIYISEKNMANYSFASPVFFW